MERQITERMEEAFRLCHHDHKGLTTKQAARRMGISQVAVLKLLERMEKIAPQLFPILTKTQAKRWHHWVNEGWSITDIAEHEGTSISAVHKTIKTVKEKLGYTDAPPVRITVMDPKDMERRTDIKRKF